MVLSFLQDVEFLLQNTTNSVVVTKMKPSYIFTLQWRYATYIDRYFAKFSGRPIDPILKGQGGRINWIPDIFNIPYLAVNGLRDSLQ